MFSLPRAEVGDGIELGAASSRGGIREENEVESSRLLLDDASSEAVYSAKGAGDGRRAVAGETGVRQGSRRRCFGSLRCFGLATLAFLVALGLAGVALIGKNGAKENEELAVEEDSGNVAEIPVSRPYINNWVMYHTQLKAKAAEEGAATRVLLLGDSITEELLCTSIGSMKQNWGDPAVWEEYYEPLGTLNLGVSGDQTQHLLWRLQNGELPDLLQPESIMVAIGTNNIGSGMMPEETVGGIQAVVKYVTEQRPNALVCVMALFPRADPYDWQNLRPWSVVDEVNELLEHMLVKFGSKVLFVNCNDRFVVTDDQGHQIINGKLILPDHLHPTGAGMDVWSACVAEDIRSGLTKDP